MIYLDNNATTRPAPEVVAAMLPYLGDLYANPSSAHGAGMAAKQAIGQARGSVASLIGAKPAEITFTASATEANHLAILGTLRARPERRHVVTTAVEHPSSLALFQELVARAITSRSFRSMARAVSGATIWPRWSPAIRRWFPSCGPTMYSKLTYLKYNNVFRSTAESTAIPSPCKPAPILVFSGRECTVKTQWENEQMPRVRETEYIDVIRLEQDDGSVHEAVIFLRDPIWYTRITYDLAENLSQDQHEEARP